MIVIKQLGIILLSSLLLTSVLFMVSLVPFGTRATTPLETIQGIAYPQTDGIVHITEPLAHFDVELREPVLAKTLVLQFQYRANNTHQLAVGVRQNSFWLSYPLNTFYQGNGTTDWQTATVRIPLTSALQDTDRSIDVMVVADPQTDLIKTATLSNPTTNWDIQNLQASVVYAWPTWTQAKQYLKSIITKERAV